MINLDLNKLLIATIFLVFIFSVKIIHSQTFIEPIIGISLSKNGGSTGNGFITYAVWDEEYFDNKNIIYGASLTQIITPHLSFKVSTIHEKDMVRYLDSGVVGYSHLAFNRLRIYALPTYKITDGIHIGIGLTYEVLFRYIAGISNFEQPQEINFIWEFGESSNQRHIGWITAISYEFKSIVASLNLINRNSIEETGTQLIRKTTSLELYLAYKLKVFNKLKLGHKRSNCPDF